MAILRQRQKNLLLAGIMGFLCAMVILGGGITLLLFRGYQIPEKYIRNELKTNEMKVESVKRTVYLFSFDKNQDEMLQDHEYRAIEMNEEDIPSNAVQDIAQISNKCLSTSVKANELLTVDRFYDPNLFLVDSDVVEINDIYLPAHLEVGDEVNIRIMFPSGQDYLVVGGKEVKAINTERTKLYLDLSEEEILNLSSARVDCTIFPSTKIYFTKKSRSYDIKEANLVASAYPMNPNVYKLAFGEYQDDGITTKRIDLDLSLFEYFDEDMKMYQYAFEELTEEEQQLYLSYQENLESVIEQETVDQEVAPLMSQDGQQATTQEVAQEVTQVSSQEIVEEEIQIIEAENVVAEPVIQEAVTGF